MTGTVGIVQYILYVTLHRDTSSIMRALQRVVFTS